MTCKQRALEAIRRMPDTVSIEEIMSELYFRQKVERGLNDLEEGRVVSHDQAKRRIAQWLQR